MGRDFTYWAHAYYERLQEINVMNEAIAADANRTPRAAYIVFDNEHGARAACSFIQKMHGKDLIYVERRRRYKMLKRNWRPDRTRW